MKSSIRITVAIIMLLGGALSLAPFAQADNGPSITVSVAALNVRQGPGTGYGVLTVMHAGDTLAVTGQNAAAGWYQVRLADGRQGWVSGSYVQLSGEASSIPEVAGPAGASATATTTTGARSTGGSVLVFQVNSGGPIYAAEVDAQGQTAGSLRYLTTGMDPALSPDGKLVAFTRWEGQNTGVGGSLWLANVDGTGERQVVAGLNQAKSPTWSADGQRIIISMQRGGSLDNTWMCMVNGQPTSVEQPQPGQRCMPQRADPYWSLRSVNVADGSYVDLTGDRHSFAPTWDPTQAWHVVYRGDRGLTNLDLNQQTTWLLKENAVQRGPVFSPDGTKIATTFQQNDHWEVHVMNADGSGEIRLTETPLTTIMDAELAGQTARQWNNAAPAWSPDGSQIAYISDRNGSYEVWAMNADGSNQHVLLGASALDGLNIQYIGVDERVVSWR